MLFWAALIYIAMRRSKCNIGMNSMIRDKAQHEVMGTCASNVATQGCFLSYKNRVSGANGATPCANLHRYKISHDNNYTLILGLALWHNLHC